MRERQQNYREEFEPASAENIQAIVAAIDGKVPIATTLEEYSENIHQLLHPDTRSFSLKRGKYMNGFAPFDGASLEMTRADIDLSERTERWNIWREKGAFTLSRLEIPTDPVDNKAYADSVIFQRMLGLNIVSSAEAKKMVQMVKEAVVF